MFANNCRNATNRDAKIFRDSPISVSRLFSYNSKIVLLWCKFLVWVRQGRGFSKFPRFVSACVMCNSMFSAVLVQEKIINRVIHGVFVFMMNHLFAGKKSSNGGLYHKSVFANIPVFGGVWMGRRIAVNISANDNFPALPIWVICSGHGVARTIAVFSIALTLVHKEGDPACFAYARYFHVK